MCNISNTDSGVYRRPVAKATFGTEGRILSGSGGINQALEINGETLDTLTLTAGDTNVETRKKPVFH